MSTPTAHDLGLAFRRGSLGRSEFCHEPGPKRCPGSRAETRMHGQMGVRPVASKGGIMRAALLGILFAGFGVAAVAAELPTARPADVGLSADRLARLDAAMQAEVDAGRKAGIVALVARHGRVAHLKSF